MTITDQVKGAAAAVKDKVAGATGTSAQVSTRVFRLHGSQSRRVLYHCQNERHVQSLYVQPGSALQGEKDAHKATEAAHDRAAKGNISNAQGHAKDAAKQTLGAADAKKDQAKSGKTV